MTRLYLGGLKGESLPLHTRLDAQPVLCSCQEGVVVKDSASPVHTPIPGPCRPGSNSYLHHSPGDSIHRPLYGGLQWDSARPHSLSASCLGWDTLFTMTQCLPTPCPSPFLPPWVPEKAGAICLGLLVSESRPSALHAIWPSLPPIRGESATRQNGCPCFSLFPALLH